MTYKWRKDVVTFSYAWRTVHRSWTGRLRYDTLCMLQDYPWCGGTPARRSPVLGALPALYKGLQRIKQTLLPGDGAMGGPIAGAREVCV